jgi:2-polyprenyl-6-methoxyphenol hydroxylase-like FAD-dependent oxidoreductase
MSSLSIAIIGAGPAGCMLARLLLRSPTPSSLKITIFEAEKSLDFRSQGGTLDLHETSGLTALKRAGLYHEFLKHARFDGAALKILDKQGKVYLNISASTNGKPEIDRSELRKLLLESLQGDLVDIKWGKRLLEVDEERKLHFADGTEEGGFDLIVGADGAWSRTRKYLDSEVMPTYAGITRYWSTIPDAQNNAPEIYKFVNRGGVFSFSDGKSLVAQQMGDGHIDVVAMKVELLEESVTTTAMEDITQQYTDWTPKLLSFLESSQPTMTRKPLYELPVGYTWGHRAGVTIIGDAAHLMTPFAGEGVNLAFVDAMKLSQAILDAKDSDHLDQQVRLYEQDMLKRATKAQAMTSGMKGAMFFTEGAPKTSIESWILWRLSYDIPDILYPVLYPMLVVGVYGVYFFLKKFN